MDKLKLNKTNYLKYFLNTAYFLCVCPFRLKLIKEQIPFATPLHNRCRYKIVTFFPQKLLCFLLTFLHLFWFLRDIRFSLPRKQTDPSAYILMAFLIISVLYKLSLLRCFWFRQTDFLKVVNFILQSENLPSAIPLQSGSGKSSLLEEMKLQLKPLLIIISTMGIGLGTFVVRKGIFGWPRHSSFTVSQMHIRHWSLDWWWESMVETGRNNFFLEVEEKYYPSGVNIFVGVINAAGFYHKGLLTAYTDVLMLFSALTLQSCVKSFASGLEASESEEYGHVLEEEIQISAISQSLKKKMGRSQVAHPRLTWPEVRNQFGALKSFSNLINQLIGTTYGYFLLESVVCYAVTLDEVFIDERLDWGKLIRFVFYFSNAVAAFYVSADICGQVSK